MASHPCALWAFSLLQNLGSRETSALAQTHALCTRTSVFTRLWIKDLRTTYAPQSAYVLRLLIDASARVALEYIAPPQRLLCAYMYTYICASTFYLAPSPLFSLYASLSSRSRHRRHYASPAALPSIHSRRKVRRHALLVRSHFILQRHEHS